MSRTLDTETVIKPAEFAHFVLRVRNLEESIAWYQTVLGMEMVHRAEEHQLNSARVLLDNLRGGLRIDVPPVHFFYILAGAAGVMFHQAEECKRVSGVDPFDPEVVEEHARAVELMLLGPHEDSS